MNKTGTHVTQAKGFGQWSAVGVNGKDGTLRGEYLERCKCQRLLRPIAVMGRNAGGRS